MTRLSLGLGCFFYYSFFMKIKLPEIIPVFPLSGIIFFPKTNLPLNIFEPKYLSLVNDSFKTNKYMGMIQSKRNSSDVYSIGCLGKITEHKKTKDGRLIINLEGISRFQVKSEINMIKFIENSRFRMKNFLKI